MADKVSFDAYMGWVNITNPNQIPEDARVISANDLLRYEKLGKDAAAKFAEIDTTIDGWKSDTIISDLIVEETSETRYAVDSMVKTAVTTGVAKFQAKIDAFQVDVNAVPTKVEAQVPPLVAAAIAKDDTVAKAATAAVNSKVAGLNLVQGTDARMPQETAGETAAYSITDSTGARSWLEISESGGPTEHSAQLIGEAAAPAISAEVAAQVPMKPISDATEYAFVIVDTDDRISFGVRSDGSTTAGSGTALPATNYIDPATGKKANIVAGPDINCIGDSLTAAGQMVAKLGTLTGRTVRNSGVGGETALGIAARQGGMPYLLAPTTKTIPASGPVDVTLTHSFGGVAWPFLQGTGIRDGDTRAIGTLAGVTGVLTMERTAEALPNYHHASDRYVFTRLASGTAVPVNKPMPFYYSYGEARRGDIFVIWQGQNGSDDEMTFAMFQAEIQHMSALDKRFLLMTGTKTATDTPGLTAMETRMMSTYGRRYINARRYLIDHALDDLKLTPTAQDRADIAAGVVPSQLRTDTVHHTVAAQQAIAEFLVHPRLKEMGWL